jgi:hypothetical protein
MEHSFSALEVLEIRSVSSFFNFLEDSYSNQTVACLIYFEEPTFSSMAKLERNPM